MRNALVEIWQVDNNGAYIHSGDARTRQARQELPGLRPVPDRLDRRILLPHDQAGPVPRPAAAHPLQDRQGRTRSCSRPSATSRATPATSRTASIGAVRDPKGQATLAVDFAPIKGSRIGELAARFDIVLGYTPEA